MTKLLHLIVSPRGGESESLHITQTFVDAYVEAHPETEVDTHNLWTDPVPTFDSDRVAAKMTVIGGETPSGEQATKWDSVVATFNRFAAADLYVIGVPMYNHGIPWILKHYIDTITQPGMLFGIDPEHGYYGLLENKKAVVAYTSGIYAPGVPPQWGADFQSNYFTDWLKFGGVSEVHEIRFQPTLFATGGTPDERRPTAIDEARSLAMKL
jgi:FMN-dependent NADH-azoreductase